MGEQVRAGGRIVPLAAALLAALVVGCGGDAGSETAQEQPAGGDKQRQKAPRTNPKKEFSCSGSVELSQGFVASNISTVGVPCDVAFRSISDTSEANFTCYQTNENVRCVKGVKILEYVEQRQG